MEKYRFLLSGSGGQGVITMAILLAGAAVLYEKRIAVQSQSYGPEARGEPLRQRDPLPPGAAAQGAGGPDQ